MHPGNAPFALTCKWLAQEGMFEARTVTPGMLRYFVAACSGWGSPPVDCSTAWLLYKSKDVAWDTGIVSHICVPLLTAVPRGTACHGLISETSVVSHPPTLLFLRSSSPWLRER